MSRDTCERCPELRHPLAHWILASQLGCGIGEVRRPGFASALDGLTVASTTPGLRTRRRHRFARPLAPTMAVVRVARKDEPREMGGLVTQ